MDALYLLLDGASYVFLDDRKEAIEDAKACGGELFEIPMNKVDLEAPKKAKKKAAPKKKAVKPKK